MGGGERLERHLKASRVGHADPPTTFLLSRCAEEGTEAVRCTQLPCKMHSSYSQTILSPLHYGVAQLDTQGSGQPSWAAATDLASLSAGRRTGVAKSMYPPLQL